MASIALIVCGAIVSVFGIIFHLQGHSIVGPTTSFMYSNPDWIDYGLWILLSGVTIILSGIAIRFFKKV
jgi:hypothetical protein